MQLINNVQEAARWVIANSPCGKFSCPVRIVDRISGCRMGQLAEDAELDLEAVVTDPRGQREVVFDKHCLPLVRGHWPEAEIDKSTGVIVRGW